ncbi:hypothetical protein KAT36_03080 [Candidatus Pacearchaeota archaeon]|nr:hypothetical protein [Candidatus Pacearchaeota archaeon]
MVIATGALGNVRKQEEYSKSVKKFRQIISDRNEELNEKIKSLESKARHWSNISGIGGISFMTSLDTNFTSRYFDNPPMSLAYTLCL